MLSSFRSLRFFRVRSPTTLEYRVDVYKKSTYIEPFVARDAVTLVDSFTVRSHETIADAARRNGMNVAISCSRGTCLSCCGRLAKGEVEMSEQVSLTHDRVSEGYILLCCAKPQSNCVVIADTSEEI